MYSLILLGRIQMPLIVFLFGFQWWDVYFPKDTANTNAQSLGKLSRALHRTLDNDGYNESSVTIPAAFHQVNNNESFFHEFY